MAGYNRPKDCVRSGQIVLSVGYGVLQSFLCATVFLLILTSILFFSDYSIESDVLDYVMIIMTLLSIFVAGFIAGYKLKTKGWLVGLLIGTLYAAISAGIGMEFVAAFSGYMLLGSKCILGALAGALGGIIGVNV